MGTLQREPFLLHIMIKMGEVEAELKSLHQMISNELDTIYDNRMNEEQEQELWEQLAQDDQKSPISSNFYQQSETAI